MFLLKKIIGSLFLPLPISSLLLIIGLFFLWRTSRQRLGRTLVTIATLILICFSNLVVSNLLLRPLERPYAPALNSAEQIAALTQPSLKWIVVLGAGDAYTPSLPSTSQLREASLSRVIEALRLHKLLPDAKIILSEGTTFDNVPAAEVMSKAMQSLGVDEKNIVLEDQSRDTEESARFVRSIVGKDPFLLVTSASHLRRSEALFRKLDMEPIPAPTDYESLGSLRPGPTDLSPNSIALRRADLAVHEYLGLLWAKLRGKL